MKPLYSFAVCMLAGCGMSAAPLQKNNIHDKGASFNVARYEQDKMEAAWKFDPEKDVPDVADLGAWLPISRFPARWETTFVGADVPLSEHTIGYYEKFLHRYANIEAIAFHPFFSRDVALLLWYPRFHSSSAFAWIALLGDDGVWHRSEMEFPFKVPGAVYALSQEPRSITVTIEERGGLSISRTFENTYALER